MLIIEEKMFFNKKDDVNLSTVVKDNPCDLMTNVV